MVAKLRLTVSDLIIKAHIYLSGSKLHLCLESYVSKTNVVAGIQ